MGEDARLVERALALVEAALATAAPSEEWADGYRTALADARRVLSGGLGDRIFEVTGTTFPAFGVAAMSGRDAAESLAAFAKAAIDRDRVGPLFYVRDPLEADRRIEVVNSPQDHDQGVDSNRSSEAKRRPEQTTRGSPGRHLRIVREEAAPGESGDG